MNCKNIEKQILDYVCFFIFFSGILLFSFQNQWAVSDQGYKFITNFSYNDYDHYPQNWLIKQAENGLIYVANQAGVLEYDGVRWSVINIPNRTARSLDINTEGIVFVGGKDEMGYLRANQSGELVYISLLTKVPLKNRGVGIVWNTHAMGRDVFFRTTHCIFHWNGEKIILWEDPKNTYIGSFLCGNTLYIQQKNKGLMKVSDDILVPISGGEIFTGNKIFMMALINNALNKNILLIGTRAIGFFLYDGKSAEPFPLEVDNLLKRSKFYYGIVLPGGEIALATLNQGIFLLDNQGRLIDTFNKQYGLQDQNVKHIFRDKQGNLWLSLNNGISRIEYDSPFSFFDSRSGLSGLILSVVRHKGDLFVGTSQGLYRLYSKRKFIQIPGITTNYRKLISTNGSLIATTSDGVFCIENQISKKILNGTFRDLQVSLIHPGQIWCTSSEGVFLLKKEGDLWIGKKQLDIPGEVLYSLQEDKKGNLWIGTSTGTIYKVASPLGPCEPKIKIYNQTHGLPDGDIYITRASERLIFATSKGLYQLDEREEKFISDQLLGKEFAGGNKPVFIAQEDENKNIWFHSGSVNYCAQPIRDQNVGMKYHIDSWPLERIPLSQVNEIYPDTQGKQVWFANIDGLFRFDLLYRKKRYKRFNVIIRRFKANDQLMFRGSSGSVLRNGGKNIFNTRNSGIIGFEFSAPFFDSESRIMYRWVLEGLDKDWSDWSKKSSQNYFDLKPGSYIFRVRAKNLYHDETPEDSYYFKILAPWYQTWWALLLFGVFAVMMIFLVFKFQRAKRIEKENIRLDAQVKERTQQISQQKFQLEKKTQQLEEQSEKLKELDQAKSRFFTNISHEFRTPLTLITSPLEILISQSTDKKQKRNFKTMLNNAHRLLRLINQLLDLSRYDSGEIPLKTTCQNIVPFIKHILDSFETIAPQNQIRVEFRSSRDNIPVFFDIIKMEQVLYNLLINAFKYTPEGGEISVFVRFRPLTPANTGFDVENNPMIFSGYAEISIKDTGKGIAEEHLPRIFDRFYQASTDKERLNTGTGIGLSVVKEIITLHHGTITVQSESQKGTEFIIKLPLGHDHLKSGEIAPSVILDDRGGKKSLYLALQDFDDFENDDEEEYTNRSDINDEVTGGQKGASEGDTPETIKISEEDQRNIILVVEDNKAVRKQIRSILEPKFKIFEAGDGQEGIDIALESIPDLIVSDIMMPKVDGYELCRKLKRDIRTSHIPIILLTAKASEESVLRGYKTRADDYITKPFNSAMLVSRIDNLIELRQQLQNELKREKMLLPPRKEISSEDEEFLKEFQEAIEKEMSKSDPDFNIEYISSKTRFSRATIYRKLPALTGEHPNEFIKSYRLKRAAQLLKENKWTVAQIAFDVGFTPAHFSKIFKEKFHKTPKDYMITEGKSSDSK